MFEKFLVIVRERWQIIVIALVVVGGGCWQMLQSSSNDADVVRMSSAATGNSSVGNSVPADAAGTTSQPVAEQKKININTASSSELQKIPGVGPAKAQLIIEYRTSKRFDSIDELLNISGIGPKTFEKLRDHVTTE